METKICKCGGIMKFDDFADSTELENVAVFECQSCGNFRYFEINNESLPEPPTKKYKFGFEIKFVFKGNYYSVSVGHETPWFNQIPFIVISQEYYDDSKNPMKVSFARILWRSRYEPIAQNKIYKYRNLPCNIVPDKDLWSVTGIDSNNSSAGVLEWCYDEEDAENRLKIMSGYKQFSELKAEKFLSDFDYVMESIDLLDDNLESKNDSKFSELDFLDRYWI